MKKLKAGNLRLDVEEYNLLSFRYLYLKTKNQKRKII